MRPRQDSAIRIRAVAVGFGNSTPRDCAISPKFRFLSPPSSAHFALRVGHFGPTSSNSHIATSFSPPSAAKWTLLAARAPSSRPPSLSASPAIFAIAINALDSPARQLFAFQLHHRRRLCTLLRRIGMKDQIPNTTDHRCSRSPAALPPSASPPSPLSPSSCRGAAVAPALLSPCVAVAVSRFSLLLLLSLARL